MTEHLLQVNEAAEKLRVSPSYLYQLVDRKQIACYRPGRRIVFSASQIENYLSTILQPAVKDG